jgi:hypothetical protein
LLLNFALEFAFRKLQGNRDGLESKGTYQFLVCAGDLDLLGGNVGITERNTEAILYVGKEDGQN